MTIKLHKEELGHKILDSYFNKNGFVSKIQIDSYNQFVTEGIQQIIDESEPIVIKLNNGSDQVTTYEIKFGRVELTKPIIKENDGTQTLMYPNLARIRNLSYMAGINCLISTKITRADGTSDIRSSKEIIGYIPIMVRSKLCTLYGKADSECIELGECPRDEGGYFIIKGGEKVIVSQERLSNNIIFCFYKKYTRVLWSAEIRSQYDYNLKTQNAVILKLFTNSANDDTLRELRVELPYIRPEIPLFVLFNALGFSYDQAREMIMSVLTDNVSSSDSGINNDYITNLLIPSMIEYNSIVQEWSEGLHKGQNNPDGIISDFQTNALIYIGQRKYNSSDEEITIPKNNNYAMSILVNSLFSHIVLTSDPNGTKDYQDILNDPNNEIVKELFLKKAYFLCHQLKKLVHRLRQNEKVDPAEIQEDDRDHLSNKRVDLTGPLLSYLFKLNFKRMKRETQSLISKNIEGQYSFNLTTAIKQKTITNGIKYSISTGNWGFQTGSTPPKIGVSQVLSRLTYISYLSHLRRLNTPINKEGKLSKPRQLHGTQWGYICGIETPEGQGCGLIKNYAITCHVSVGSLQSHLLIKNLAKKELLPFESIGSVGLVGSVGHGGSMATKVLLDGDWLGNTTDPQGFTDRLKNMRRQFILDPDTSIAWFPEDNEILIFTCQGRCIRPLVIAEKYKELLGSLGSEGLDNISDRDVDNNGSALLKIIKDWDWDQLMASGLIENIDPLEEETTMIATYYSQCSQSNKYTHIEIDNSVILGISASSIPFSDHNQCINHLEPVLMADGTTKPIKDIKLGDMVVTFNPDTLERSFSKVVHHFVNKTEKKIHEIMTLSGRKIIATFDHRFWTNEGFVRVQDFKETTKLAVNDNGATLFEEIKSVADYTECDIIADITVESENHTFMANNFLIHNSPRNIYQSAAIHTEVFLADGTRKQIKDIKLGDVVVTFNPETLERSYSKVIDHYVKPTDKPMFKVRTVSGREIITTDDHHYYTNHGFIELKNFTEATRLAIDLNHKQGLDTGKTLLVDPIKFTDLCIEYGRQSSTVNKYLEQLEQFTKECPNTKIAMLAGIIGFLLADGSLSASNQKNKNSVSINASFCCSSEQSALSLIKDMEYLGFGRRAIHKSVSTFESQNKNGTTSMVTHTGYTTSYSGSFSMLLMYLGVMFGRRTEKHSSIPEFILNGTKEIKREFLSGLFGGDGSKIRYNPMKVGKAIKYNTYNYTLNTLSMCKIPEHVGSLEEFMSDVAKMLGEFGIATNYVHNFEAKHGTIGVHLGFSQTQENIIKFYDEIGYKYDIYKIEESGHVVEYLRYKEFQHRKRIEHIEKIRKRIDDGLSNPEIAQEFKMKTYQISDIRRSYKNGRKISVRKNNVDFMTPEEFMAKNPIRNGTIFEQIESIEPYKENNMISDITVESENHSFIAADGFLIHNSSMGSFLPITGSSGFARIRMERVK
jgi:DNA-directed RNA polymerase beta subunit